MTWLAPAFIVALFVDYFMFNKEPGPAAILVMIATIAAALAGAIE